MTWMSFLESPPLPLDPVPACQAFLVLALVPPWVAVSLVLLVSVVADFDRERPPKWHFPLDHCSIVRAPDPPPVAKCARETLLHPVVRVVVKVELEQQLPLYQKSTAERKRLVRHLAEDAWYLSV